MMLRVGNPSDGERRYRDCESDYSSNRAGKKQSMFTSGARMVSNA